MSSPAVTQSLALCSSAVEAVALAKRAALQTARSWSEIASYAFQGDRPGAWTVIDMGFASAESFVTAQTNFANGVLDATAAAFGVAPTKNTPGGKLLPAVAVVPASAPSAPKPVAKVAPAAASAPSAPKPVAKVAPAAAAAPSTPKPAARNTTKPKGPKASGSAKHA